MRAMLRRAAVGRLVRWTSCSLAPLAVALACATPPPPGPPPSCSDAPGSRARYDAASGACDCTPAAPLAWQSAAPRTGSEPVREKEAANIALRRVGTADFQEKDVDVVVVSDGGVAATATDVLAPPEWVQLQYPQDFPLGAAHRAGVYTVLWKVDGAVVACDGFVIEPEMP
jgi:hypothetical protein